MWNKATYNVLFSILLIAAVVLTACGNDTNGNAEESDNASNPSNQETAGRVLTDVLGNEVPIPDNPQRVIASYLEDHLIALGIKPIAQWSVSDGKSVQDYLQEYLHDVDTIPHDLPFEVIASFSPDLIIMGSAATVDGGKYDQYAKIAPTYVAGIETNDNWQENLRRIGEIFGLEEKAEEVLEAYEAKAENAKERIKEAIGDETAAALWLVGGSLFIVSENMSSGAVLYGDLQISTPEVVKEISQNGTDNWLAVSLEKLATLDADHLFLINSDIGGNKEIFNDNLWQNIPAVKKGNVYEYPASTSWLYSGAIANGQTIDAVLESLVSD